MGSKILKRLLFTVIVLLGVSIISFIIVRIAPGDPAVLMLPEDASPEQVEAMRIRMGLDKPLLTQYLLYIGNVLRGDLGYSFAFKMNCSEVIWPRLLNTFYITVFGVLIGILISIPLGIVAGINRGSAIDTFAVGFSLFGQACSPVWFCLFLILVFGVKLRWLPSQGIGTFRHMIMPAFTIGLNMSSMIVRLTRSTMIDVLDEDHITATRARGIRKTKVYFKYAFKNAVLPVITALGGLLGGLLGGSMVMCLNVPIP